MEPSQKCIDLIKRLEGIKLHSYRDVAFVWTIGIGTTIYPNGDHVKEGETCTEEQANEYLLHDLKRRTAAIGELPVNQNQYDAIVSLVYNIGITNWNNSTLRKLVKHGGLQHDIRAEFMKWCKVRKRGKLIESAGLKNRRQIESDLYFS